MKNKICKYCKEIIYYKEWKRTNLSSDWGWLKKKFCDYHCAGKYHTNQKKEMIQLEFVLDNKQKQILIKIHKTPDGDVVITANNESIVKIKINGDIIGWEDDLKNEINKVKKGDN